MSENSTDLATPPAEQLYFVRIVFGEKGIDFQLQSAPSGIRGMVAFDATPSAMLTVSAVSPGHACSDAWHEVVRAMGTRETMKMCSSVEEFSEHVAKTILGGI